MLVVAVHATTACTDIEAQHCSDGDRMLLRYLLLRCEQGGRRLESALRRPQGSGRAGFPRPVREATLASLTLLAGSPRSKRT